MLFLTRVSLERVVAWSHMVGNILILKCMTRFDANVRRRRVTVKSGAVVIFVVLPAFLSTRHPTDRGT